MKLSFKLEVFEGPLDLLLHLISKHKLNINDIPIVILLEQYLDYINGMAELNMSVTGEFLEMASRLVYIKALSLLPSQNEAEALRKELQGQLIELDLCRRIAGMMKNRYIGDKVTVRRQENINFDNTYSVIHDKEVLFEAYMAVKNRIKISNEPVKKEAFNTIIAKRIISVSDRIYYVLDRIYKNGWCMTDKLFKGINDRQERTATFLAVLELIKSGRILLNDDNTVIYLNKDYKKLKNDGEITDNYYDTDNTATLTG